MRSMGRQDGDAWRRSVDSGLRGIDETGGDSRSAQRRYNERNWQGQLAVNAPRQNVPGHGVDRRRIRRAIGLDLQRVNKDYLIHAEG